MKMNLHAGVYGSVKFERSIVCAKTGRTVKRFPVQPNLLFDLALNNLATMEWPYLFDYFVLGTGTTPTRRDSGAVKFTRSGNNIVADANFFEAGDTGRLLQWDTGEKCYLTYVDGTHATSNVAGTVAAAEGTIHYVNRVALGNEVKRTNTKTSDTGDHGYSWNGTTGVLSTWKTLIFSAETETITFKEIGWSRNSSGANDINGAALLAGGGDTLVADQQYKVKLQLDRVITPRVPRALLTSDVVDAWTGNAEEVTERAAFSVWDAAGNVWGMFSGGFRRNLEPSLGLGVYVSTDSRALEPTSISNFSDIIGIASVNATASPYVNGSFVRDYAAVFDTSAANSTAIRSVFIRNAGDSFDGCTHRVLFDSAQSKTSSQKLTIRFRKSWGRVLVN